MIINPLHPLLTSHSSPASSSSASSPLLSDLPPLSKVTHHSNVALPTNSSVQSQDSFNQAAIRAAKYATSLYYRHFLLSHMYVLIMVCFSSSLCVILSSVNSATWCRGGGKSACCGKDRIQEYRWRTDRLLAGVACLAPHD